MSFFTSFCDFPQKEQQSVWFSRLSTNAPPFSLLNSNLTLLRGRSRFLGHHFVDQAVLLGLTRAHEVVAISVLFDAIERLAGVLLHDLVELCLEAEDFLGVQLDVARLSPEAAGGLVDHDPRMR